MTNSATNAAFRRVRLPAYLVFSLAFFYELVDVMVALRPYNFGVSTWRFGAIGVSSNAFAKPLTLLVLMFAVAAVFADRKVMRTLGAIAGLAAVVFLAMLVDFSLGALQIRDRVPAAETTKFLIATGVAALKMVTLGAASGLLSYSAFKAAGTGGVVGRESNVIMPSLSHDPIKARSTASTVGSV